MKYKYVAQDIKTYITESNCSFLFCKTLFGICVYLLMPCTFKITWPLKLLIILNSKKNPSQTRVVCKGKAIVMDSYSLIDFLFCCLVQVMCITLHNS